MSIKLKPLNEQVIVITGASSGIGLATALEAAKRGAKVVLGARSIDSLHETVSRIKAEGGIAHAVECDVTDRPSVDALAAAAVQRFGRIDTWVNDAGLGLYGRVDATAEDDARKLFDINFWGLYHGCMAALPHLDGGGLDEGDRDRELVDPPRNPDGALQRPSESSHTAGQTHGFGGKKPSEGPSTRASQ